MATSVNTIVTRLRERCDQESSTRITTAIAEAWVNNWIADLWDLIRFANPTWFEGTKDTTLVGGTVALSRITVEADFLSVLGVERDPDTVGRRFLPSYEQQSGPGGLCYRLTAQTIEIAPYESAAGTYRTHYIQGPTVISGTANIDARIEPFVDYIISGCCMFAHARDEEQYDLDDKLFQMQRARVMQAAVSRDQARPMVVPDPAGYATWVDPNLLRLP